MCKFYYFLLAVVISFSSVAQVAIGETDGVPDPSSILDLQSASKGLLAPRMTESQRNAIPGPATGLIIFNTTSNCTNVFNGENWFELCGTCTPPAPVGLGYADNGPLVYCIGESIEDNDPGTISGIPVSYSVSPELPPGLSFNSSTGRISGIPQSVSPPNNYTVTASNSCGSDNRVLNIVVSQYLEPLGVISGPATPTAGGNNVVYSIPPVDGAGGYEWSIPSGWFVIGGAGTHSILVSPGTESGQVSVTVSSPCSTLTEQLSVNPWRPLVATGGNSVNDIVLGGVTYRVHSFTTSGTSSFAVSDEGTEATVEYLVIGGGGGGGGNTHSQNGSGGGGAGGYRCSVVSEQSGGGMSAESALSVATGSYTVTVGAGGAGQVSSEGRGANGANSVFGPITAIGGGGGSGSQAVASSGGSGGAGDSYTGNAAGNAARIGANGTSGQGFSGGNGADNSGGGGGGGAGSAGATAAGGMGGNGGQGVSSSITGTSIARCGGGGGGGWNAATPGQGGAGGGGNAGGQNSAPQAGAANTGSGGGASKSGYAGGSGGSGVVIVRYPITNPN